MQSRSANAAPHARMSSRDRVRVLLDAVLDVVLPAGRPRDLAQALSAWLGEDVTRRSPYSVADRVVRRLTRDIAELDERISEQVNAVLHHPTFQQLEAGWRGLRYLIEQIPELENPYGKKPVKVFLLNVSFREMQDDLGNASEFDQSELFRRVYSENFDMPGGEPIGVLIGNYEFTNHPEHIDVLEKLAEVAAAAFAPFIAAAHPALLDLEHFHELERPGKLTATFAKLEFQRWDTLRKKADTRFLGLTLPRILLRDPYRDDFQRVDKFRFHEDVGRPDGGDYLWGNAAFAFGAVLVRTFIKTGWFGDIRGVRRGKVSGGLVTGLPASWFSTDKAGHIPRTATEVIITDKLERELSDLGFLPLCWCQDTAVSVFAGSQSIQKPKAYNRQEATMNARISTMLQYIFCASRFGHYLKVMIRDKVGGEIQGSELEYYLHRWLQENYVNDNPTATSEMKAEYPLRAARVEIKEIPGKPGHYRCNLFLSPQFQLDQLVGQISLATTMAGEITV